MTVKGKWLTNEIDFLKENYNKMGGLYCSEKLNRDRKSINKKAASLGLKSPLNKRYVKEYFSDIVKNSINYVDCCRNLGLKTTMGNRQTIKKYIKIYNLDTSHFRNGIPKPSNKQELSDILVEHSTYSHTTNLKNRLYKEGLKERECEICGQDEIWNGKRISLILDHINGVHDDNRIENLRVVCPNCNATLETHGGKNINRI